MRALLLNVKRNIASEVDIKCLNDYYRHLECSTFDVVRRILGNKVYDIYLDDEGMFVSDPIISAVDKNLQLQTVGNLIFCGPTDSEGYQTGLSDYDIRNIKSYIKPVLYTFGKKRHFNLIVTEME